jgi:hypothetical protein
MEEDISMKRNRVFVLSLLLFPAWSQAEEEGTLSFQDATMAVLGQQVKDLGAAYVQTIVDQIAQESGVDAAEVRTKLKEMLGELEAQRQGKTEVWNSLVAARGEEIEEKQVDKFFKELIKSMSKVLDKKGNYALESLVVKAAGKAKMQSYHGKDFLVMLLNPGEAAAAMPTVDLPEKIGLVLQGSSNYAIDQAAFEPLLISSSDRLTLKKVRDVHKGIAKVFAQELEGSGFIKWTLDKPNPKLTPDCQLEFEVDWFSTSPRSGGVAPQASSVQTGGEGAVDGEQGVDGQPAAPATTTSTVGQQALPIVYLGVQMSMKHVESGVMVYTKRMEINYDFENEQDDRIRSLRALDNFHLKVGKEMKKELDQFLAAQQANSAK